MSIKQGYSIASQCEVESVTLDLKVKGSIGSLYSSSTFYNSGDELVEAIYEFPLDSNWSVYEFSAKIEDRLIVAECLSKSEAKEVYDEAKSKGHVAALMTEDRSMGDTFTICLGNIGKQSRVEIQLRLVGSLDLDLESADDPMLRFTMPSVLNPRYRKCLDREIYSSSDRNLPQTNVEYKLTFSGSVESAWDMASIDGFTEDKFQVDFDKNIGSNRMATFKLVSDFKRDHDLRVNFHLDKRIFSELVNSAIFEPGKESQSSANGKDFLSLGIANINFIPSKQLVAQTQVETRNDVIFIVDRSGSMSGSNIQQAQQSLRLLLSSLPVGCRFQIIGFGSSCQALFSGGPTDYNEQSVKQAKSYADSMEADMGGTEILGALQLAFSTAPSGQGWFKQIILLTDGDVGNTNEVCGLVSKHTSGARVFAIGLGVGASTALVNGLARAGQGKAVFVQESKELRAATMRILNLALQPRINDLQLEWIIPGKTSEESSKMFYTIPSRFSPAFFNESWQCFAVFTGDCSDLLSQASAKLTFCLSGESKPRSLQSKLTIVSGKDTLPIHRLAAKSQINELTDQLEILASANDRETCENRIKQISTQANVLSKLTGFVAVDKNFKHDLSDLQKSKKIYLKSDNRSSEVMDCCDSLSAGYAQKSSLSCKMKKSMSPIMNLRCRTFANSAQLDCMDEDESSSLPCFAPPPPTCNERRRSGFLDTCRSIVTPTLNKLKKKESPTDSSTKNLDESDLVLRLSDLQKVDGSWESTAELAKLLSSSAKMLPLDELLALKPTTVASNAIFITLCCLVALEKHCSDKKDEWILFAQKAQSFIALHLSLTDMAEVSNLIKNKGFIAC